MSRLLSTQAVFEYVPPPKQYFDLGDRVTFNYKSERLVGEVTRVYNCGDLYHVDVYAGQITQTSSFVKTYEVSTASGSIDDMKMEE